MMPGIDPVLVSMLVNVGLLAMMLVMVGGVIQTRSLLTAIVQTGVYSLLSTLWLMAMDAPDVAFTEAMVGAGVSTVLLLGAILLTKSETARENKLAWIVPASVALATGGLLIYAVQDLPAFGDAGSAASRHLGRYYLENTRAEIDVPNVVTAVLASYRGFDTLGETTVVFAAGLGVALLIGVGERALSHAPRRELAQMLEATMDRDDHVVLRVAAKFLIPMIAMFSFYVLFHGDLSAGGGFQGGVILAVAVILHALVFGLGETMQAIRPGFVRGIAALGVLVYASVGVVTLLNGGAFLDYDSLFPAVFAATLPAGHNWGQFYGILAIEAGVMMTVAATMVSLLYAFAGRAPDAELDAEAVQ